MIFNQELERLLKMEEVQSFMQKQAMRAVPVVAPGNCSLVLVRLPYFIEFQDALVENYLGCFLADVSSDLWMSDGDIFCASVTLGFHDRNEVKNRNYEEHPYSDVFLSFRPEKMLDLNVDLEAVDKLLPKIEARGGLSSLRDGTFHSSLSFSNMVSTMPVGRKDRLLRCIEGNSYGGRVPRNN